ncbi:MAG TPA: 30S ribosomal protein S6 [Ktedonobacterales bacterium]|nr:30S ribosomal protein S6 [Ktedonobacterales bacterium]
MARDYELGVIINPEVGDEQARAIVERVANIIGGNGGQVVRVNAWGRRRLAYPIEHHRDGLYFFYDLMLEPQSVAEIERDLRVNEDIIRHLMKLRDSRVVAQQRQRDIERDAELAQQQAEAAARAEAAEAEAARVREAGEVAPAEEVAETAETGETGASESGDTATPEAVAASETEA